MGLVTTNFNTQRSKKKYFSEKRNQTRLKNLRNHNIIAIGGSRLDSARAPAPLPYVRTRFTNIFVQKTYRQHLSFYISFAARIVTWSYFIYRVSRLHLIVRRQLTCEYNTNISAVRLYFSLSPYTSNTWKSRYIYLVFSLIYGLGQEYLSGRRGINSPNFDKCT